jgi:hypothetical protein
MCRRKTGSSFVNLGYEDIELNVYRRKAPLNAVVTIERINEPHACDRRHYVGLSPETLTTSCLPSLIISVK